MALLLDTNIIVDYLRERAAAVNFVETLNGKPRVSVVTVAELFAGARSRREEDRIDSLLDAAVVLPVTYEISKRAGQAMKHYQRSHGLDDFDALIGATAEHHGLALATLNVKHFPMLDGLKRAY